MKNKLKLFAVITVSIFAVYNIVWAMYVSILYQSFTSKMNGLKQLKTDEYTYYVKKPNYLSFVGNLSISENVDFAGEEKVCSGSLIIWPKLRGKCSVAVNISVTQIDYSKLTRNTEVYGIMLNEKRTPDFTVPGVYEIYMENKELFDNMELIDSLYDAADDMWDVFAD